MLKYTALFCMLAMGAHASQDHGFEVLNAYAYAPLKGVNSSVAYMEFHNHGEQDINVTGVKADVTPDAELHDHIDEGDVMRMQRVDMITVPAGGVVPLKSGGKHVMLINMPEPVAPGDMIALQLQLEDGRSHDVQVPVVVRQRVSKDKDMHVPHSDEADSDPHAHHHH